MERPRGYVRRIALPLGAALVLILCGCNSQPAKYRHSNDCKCPKWNYVPKAPVGTEHAGTEEVPTPYHCAASQPS